MKEKRLYILLGIILFAMILRLYSLGGENLWLDEADSVRIARLPVSSVISDLSSKDANSPLYFFILHYWIDVFGDSEFSLRFPSVLFGLASIALFFFVGEKLFNTRTGLFAAFIVSCSTFHLHYSQEARCYMLMTALMLSSMYFYISLFERTSKWNAVGYIVSTLLLLLTHPFGLFIPFIQNCVFFAAKLFKKQTKTSLSHWMMIQVVLGGLFFSWAIVFLGQFSRYQHGIWIPKPTWLFFPQCILVYSGTNTIWGRSLCALFGIFTLVGLKKFFWDNKEIFSFTFLSFWLIIPILTPFVVSFIFFPITIIRYTICASFALYLFTAIGMEHLRNGKYEIVAVACIIVLSLANTVQFFQERNNEPWGEVAGDIKSQLQPDDIIYLDRSYCQTPFDYYFKRTDIKEYGIYGKFTEDTSAIRSSLLQQFAQTKRFWLIFSHTPDSIKAYNNIMGNAFTETFHKYYNVVGYDSHQTYPEVELYCFEKK